MISIAAQENFAAGCDPKSEYKGGEAITRPSGGAPSASHGRKKKKKDKKTPARRIHHASHSTGSVVSERVQICFFVREKCSLKLKKRGVDDGISHSLIKRRQRRDKLFL